MLNPWDVTPREAIAIQQALRDRVVAQPPPGFAPRLVAGADISVGRFEKTGYAALVVIDRETRAEVDRASARETLTFPYVPGLLSFRELPALLLAWERLTTRPDVLIFDGNGLAHPRRFGIACHGGVLLDLPTIGCAKSILVGAHEPLAEAAGSTAPLVHRGEVVGMAVRLRARVQPVYVSIGHLVDLETAVAVVQSVATGLRLPETTRRAHDMVNRMRREDRSEA